MVRLCREPRWGARVRALASAALALSLVIIGTQADASALVLEEVRPTAATAMSSQSMPAAFDCMPCARCFVAPAPATHGSGGDDQAPEELRWHVPRPPAFNAIFFDTGSRYIALPVRIAFCRWLD